MQLFLLLLFLLVPGRWLAMERGMRAAGVAGLWILALLRFRAELGAGRAEVAR